MNSQFRLALTLLVSRIDTDHVDLALTFNDLAIFANSLHTSLYFHLTTTTKNRRGRTTTRTRRRHRKSIVLDCTPTGQIIKGLLEKFFKVYPF